MNFSQRLKESISDLHLLNHPFYQAWNRGELSMQTLREYASEYLVHVKAFPRYISATHSKSDNINHRRLLLENLADEEGFNGENHPELWMRFLEGLGEKRENEKESKAIRNVINTFMKSADSSFAEGLSSLYAYEYQVPEVADTKITGLKENYDISDERTLSFFEVHKKADVYHRQACEEILDQLPESEHERALIAAKRSAQALWDFLSDVYERENAA